MNRTWLGLGLWAYVISGLWAAVSLEEAKVQITADAQLDEAERNRQIAGLYRLSGQMKESFDLLKESIEKHIFNEWMIEDYAALGASLKRENTVAASARELLSNVDPSDKMGGILLKGLLEFKKAPERVLNNLKVFGETHAGRESSGLFVLLLGRVYAALGNVERSYFFKDLMDENFPDYYQLRKVNTPKPSITTSRPTKEPQSLLQVGSFKANNRNINSFTHRLETLGQKPILLREDDIIRVRLATDNQEELTELLQREGIDFYVVKGTPLGTPSLDWNGSGAKSTVQVGIFSTPQAAEAHKKALTRDGFQGSNVIYQETNHLFYVFLNAIDPAATLQRLKSKGYDAFIKNLE